MNIIVVIIPTKLARDKDLQQKFVHSTASGLKLNTEFRKVPYWDLYYSTDL